MESMFDMPRPVELSKQWAYIDTYGAFFVHCGATAMGCPGDNDKHPVHGDLPNAPYQSAYLGAGADARGQFLEIGGSYKHTVAFTENWEARPRVRLYADASTISIEMRITNHFAKAMDLMRACPPLTPRAPVIAERTARPPARRRRRAGTKPLPLLPLPPLLPCPPAPPPARCPTWVNSHLRVLRLSNARPGPDGFEDA